MPRIFRYLFLLACGLASILVAAEPAPATPASSPTAIPAAMAQAITREVLRPNGDPEGYPLPLAARWCGHNWTNADTLSPTGGNLVSYPFPLDRVLDDIAAGHRVMPFMGWPHAKAGPGGYYEATDSLMRGFRRLAAAKLPFEIEAGNIEGAIFGPGDAPLPPYVHRPAAENAAFLANGPVIELTAAAEAGTKSLAAKGLGANAVLPAGTILLAAKAGRAVVLATEAKADANGAAALALAEPLPMALPAGENLLRLERRPDFWSRAPEEVWRAGGAAVAFQGNAFGAADWKRLGELYPDPPQVQIVSNNEGARVRISEAGASWHAQHAGGDANTTFAAGYIRNWGAYLRGMREALPWKPTTVKAIGYNAFGCNFEVGRWGGWAENMIPVGKADSYEWLAWDGSAPDHYAYDWNYATDEHVGSPHIGAMQAYAMLAPRAMAERPDYLWQLALWDGGIKKRYRYAADGTIPGIAVATVAEAPKDGDRSLRIRGVKPGAQLFAAGELIGIDGHSRGLPTRCRATFDNLTVEADGGASAPGGALHALDIGAVPMPGSLEQDGGTIRLAGSGRALRIGAHDALYLAHRPMAGQQSITVRLADFGSGAAASTKPTGPAVDLPQAAAHVDRQELERQRARELAGPEDQAGLMLRLGTGPDAAFLSLMRARTGRLSVFWRGQDDPTTTGWCGAVAGADTPPGPVWLRWTLDRTSKPLGNRWRAWWSADGKDWKEVMEAGNRPWISPNGKELVGGLAITTWRIGQEYRSYTVAKAVRADEKGEAVVPLAVSAYAGPVGMNAAHPAIAAGATVERLDYLSRYEGFCTLALWLSRPRILREFAWADYESQIENQWPVAMRVVDRVWSDPVLTRFWRKGRWVANPAFSQQAGRHHPMPEIGEFWGKRWAGLDCFFQLSSPVNPPFATWPTGSQALTSTYPDSTSVVKVWAIAYELGTTPKREWLLLVQSPREDRKGVVVTVPGFGDATVEVPRSGAFYHLREGTKETVRVGGN
jgi:hypothetical protein